MYRFASSHGDPGDFEMAIWDSMYYMDHYNALAEDGIIMQEMFDSAFLSYLNNGTPLDADKLWNPPTVKRKNKLGRTLNLFKKK